VAIEVLGSIYIARHSKGSKYNKPAATITIIKNIYNMHIEGIKTTFKTFGSAF
jgi:hypothetical protein